MIPYVMDCQLWYGRVKNRVAKKYLRDCFRNKKLVAAMADIKEGDLVRNCSGFNMRVGKISPCYVKVGKGSVLLDIDLESDTGAGCSFAHCGIEPAWTREATVRWWEESCKYWLSVGDPWHFAQMMEFTTIDREGKQVFDSEGYYKKYPKDKY